MGRRSWRMWAAATGSTCARSCRKAGAVTPSALTCPLGCCAHWRTCASPADCRWPWPTRNVSRCPTRALMWPWPCTCCITCPMSRPRSGNCGGSPSGTEPCWRPRTVPTTWPRSMTCCGRRSPGSLAARSSRRLPTASPRSPARPCWARSSPASPCAPLTFRSRSPPRSRSSPTSRACATRSWPGWPNRPISMRYSTTSGCRSKRSSGPRAVSGPPPAWACSSAGQAERAGTV